MTTKTLLRAYGWLFLASGAAFVAASGLLAAALDLAGRSIGGGPSLAGPPTLWLVLTGSMMAMISRLAFRLAADPDDETAWESLLLSKACSTTLFCVFAALRADPLFLVGALTDGPILAHLLWLRARAESPDPLAPRLPRARGPFHEAWFARVNDGEGWAAWVRLTLRRGPAGDEAALWVVLFPPDGPPRQERWAMPLSSARFGSGALVDLPDGALRARALEGLGAAAGFKLEWEPGEAPALRMVPRWLAWTGLAGSEYVSACPAALLSGTVRVAGLERAFRAAPGCVGHVWGRRYGRGWWWAHARLGGSVVELLSAPGPLGLRLTAAALWHEGRARLSTSLPRLLLNGSRRTAEGWRFAAGFPGGPALSGACSAPEASTASLLYEGPGGERLVCRNSKTGAMTARVAGDERSCPAQAAVEFVEPA